MRSGRIGWVAAWALGVLTLATLARDAAGQQEQAVGGVGIAFAPEGQRLRVAGLMPNGPAERAGVKEGDTLLEVDGAAVADAQQAPARIRGPVGTDVKLAFDRGGQRVEFTLRRVAIGAPGGGGNAPPPPPANGGGKNPLDGGGGGAPPAAGGGIGGALGQLMGGNGAAPAKPAAGQLPFLAVGTRLTYHAGESNIAGMHFVEDPNGQYHFRDGRKCRPEAASGQSGGVGFHQVSVAHADANLTVGDVRNYLITDVNRNTCSYRDGGVTTGDGQALGDYWINPTRLAQMQDGRADDGSTVQRGVGTFNGKQINTIAIRSTKPHYSSAVYDLATGVLLSAGTSDTDPDMVAIDERGNAHVAQGGSSFTHRVLVAVRQTNVPWAGEAPPQWAQVGKRLDYQGTLQVTYQGGQGLPPLPGQATTLSYQFDRDLGGGCFAVQALVRSDLGRGIPPSETRLNLCASSGAFGALWISPRVAQQLKANQVLDEDPVTRVRTFYAGTRGNVGTVVQQGENETLEINYDLGSGVMVGSRLTTRVQNNIGTSVLTYQLVNR